MQTRWRWMSGYIAQLASNLVEGDTQEASPSNETYFSWWNWNEVDWSKKCVVMWWVCGRWCVGERTLRMKGSQIMSGIWGYFLGQRTVNTLYENSWKGLFMLLLLLFLLMLFILILCMLMLLLKMLSYKGPFLQVWWCGWLWKFWFRYWRWYLW